MKTKIMHITYDMRIGGTEMVIKNLIDGANKKQFEMSVLCIESPLGPFAQELLSNGIKIETLKRKPGFDTSLISAIRRTIKANNIDIIHCHQYTPWVYGVIAAALTGTKVIFTEHGRFYPDSSTWKRKLINPILNIFTHQVTAISRATKQALIEYENIPAQDIEIIYNGIAPIEFDEYKVNILRKKLNIPENHTVLGTVARFDPIKNHSMMLNAFANILTQQPNCTLLIVGDGEERENIEKCIENLNIKNNVILTGYEQKPVHHIALMDLFLLSSLSEGTSMTLLEAMSIGKPCVVTDAGGNPEIIFHNKNGLVTSNDNEAEFSKAIQTLLCSPELLKIQGSTGKEMFYKLFEEKIMNQKFSLIYQKLALKR
ncbi:glycosyltransferase [Paraglaciecola sp. L3A3]|uniref:glycosyltransferase n=1 Tax=Paraglaciecola sp. L3A3 TaxID=2686358 RepID=UPI00131C3BDE|nr:glycosyltransferase [Paraglaciecola sp. L3A3]